MTLKYDEHGHPYEDLTEENKKLKNRIKELDNSLVIALDINDKYQRDNKKLKERAQEAEGEMTIVKGIGMNSPEMREAKARIEELESDRESLKKEIDRLSEYNQNLKTMINGKNTSNSC